MQKSFLLTFKDDGTPGPAAESLVTGKQWELVLGERHTLDEAEGRVLIRRNMHTKKVCVLKIDKL